MNHHEPKSLKATTIWLTADDQKVLAELTKKTGLKQVQLCRVVLRMALRRWRELFEDISIPD